MITKWISIEIHCDNEDCDNVFKWGNEYTTIKRAVDLAKSTKGWKIRSEEHTSELQSLVNLVCRLLLEKKKNIQYLLSVHS